MVNFDKSVRVNGTVSAKVYAVVMGVVATLGQIGIALSLLFLLDTQGVNVVEFQLWEWLLLWAAAVVPMILWRFFVEEVSETLVTRYRFKTMLAKRRAMKERQDS